MYSSHVYLATTTWGDLFRLYKYFNFFQEWDDRRGSRLFLVYPAQLTETVPLNFNLKIRIFNSSWAPST